MIEKIKFKDTRLDELCGIIEDLLYYRAHLCSCEINYTDFCTCGLKQVADTAREILNKYKTND